MGKGLDDFDYDTLGEALNNIAAIREQAELQTAIMRDLRVLLAALLLIVIPVVIIFLKG